MIRDLSDDEARRALLKWSAVPPDTIPAWVAEMDYALAPVVADALRAAVEDQMTGYTDMWAEDRLGDHLQAPDDTTRVAEALRGFTARQWEWDVPAGATTLAGDVIAGIRLVLDRLVPPGPIVLPTPCYPPFREIITTCRRETVLLPVDPDAADATLDLAALDAAFAAGARGLILCSPHNPLGRVWRRAELEGVREVAQRHGARVLADEIHAPLTLPGAVFTPYASVDPRGIVVTSASKAFNTPGLHCAQILTLDPADTAHLRSAPLVENHGVSRLGVAASAAAYAHGDPWLAALVQRLSTQRALLGDLLDAHLPQARMRPLEATYLAWLDLRAYGVEDPATAAREHGAWPAPGQDYEPGLGGHVRLNLATSPERLTALVERIAAAVGA